jgi:hypothetical protein
MRIRTSQRGLVDGGVVPTAALSLSAVGLGGSSRFVVNGPAEEGVHAAVFAALASRIRVR